MASQECIAQDSGTVTKEARLRSRRGSTSCRAEAVPSVGLAIAGLGLRVRSHDEEFLSKVATVYWDFVADRRPDLVIDLEISDGLVVPVKPGVTARHVGHELFVAREDFQGKVDLNAGRGTLMQGREVYSLDAFLRVVISVLMAGRDGMLIHGTSIIKDGKGYLFFGPSGSGKSTIASVSADCLVLGDELSAIRRVDGAYVLYGTPFWSSQSSAKVIADAPLCEVYRIHHGSYNRRDPLQPAAAFRSLLPEVILFGDNEGVIERITDTCARLSNDARCYELFFLPDRSLWEVVGC